METPQSGYPTSLEELTLKIFGPNLSPLVLSSLRRLPHSKLKIDDVLGYPIYGADQDCVHLAQVMAGTAPHEVDGKIIDAPCLVTAGDYVLIACGVADTIGTARRRAYKVLDGIKIPNGPFYRTDIGVRLKKELEGLHKHGFAEGLVY